jgi:hypothetical protein
VKKHATIESALEVAEDALHTCEMGLTGVMHMEADLLDHVRNVKPGEGEGEILESPGQATISSQFTNEGPCRRRPWPMTSDH